MATAKIEADIHHEDEDDIKRESTGTRLRTLTERGLEYTCQVKTKRLEQLCRAMDKVSDNCMIIIDSESGSIHELRKKHKTWLRLYNELTTIDDEYRKLLSPSEVDQYHTNWYLKRKEAFTHFKITVENWFSEHAKQEEELQESIHSHDSVSQIGISRLYENSVFNKSKSSVKSSCDAYEQKKAELHTRKVVLQHQKEMQEELIQIQHEENKIQERRLKLQEKQLELEESVIDEAQSKVLDELSKASQLIKKKISNGPDIGTSDENGLLSIVRHLNKPRQEIKTFSGDPLEYQQFKRQFRTRIMKNCDTCDEQISYLEQYTSGEPRRIVSAYCYLDADIGFPAAFKELDERYGDTDIIVNAFVKKALNWPNIKKDCPKDLDAFGIFLSECEYAVKDLHSLKVLEYSENFKRIVSILPYTLHDKWRSIAQGKKVIGKRPTFSDLVEFVRCEARKATDPSFGKEALINVVHSTYHDNSSKHPPKSSFATSVDSPNQKHEHGYSPLTARSAPSTDKPSAYAHSCSYCKGPHSLDACENISLLPFLSRIDFLKSNGLCFGCLRYGHHRQSCQNKSTCKYCEGRHPSILHVDGPIPTRNKSLTTCDSSTQTTAQTTSIATACSDSPGYDHHSQQGEVECTMAIIPVKVRAKGSNRTLYTYAFLDPGSNVSFCDEKLMFQLGIQGRKRKLAMETMGSPRTIHTFELHDIEVLDLEERNVLKLPAIYTKDKMPVSKQHIPTWEDLQRWPHLSDIPLPQVDADVGLLIGNNVPDACTPIEVRVGPRGSPYISRSILGWIPWNVIRAGHQNSLDVNRGNVVTIDRLYDRHEPSKQDSHLLERLHSSQ